MMQSLAPIDQRIGQCKLCAERFAATASAHEPRPVVWFDPENPPRILIAGQAPGAKVYASGRPFTDPSGDRIRYWMGIDEATFYQRGRIAIVPMAFCFPGYDAKGSDLPPPVICARTWRAELMQHFSAPPLTLLVGGHAMRWHLQQKATVQASVRNWQNHAPKVFPLPHPSWRNTAWLKKNPWFETDLLPVLRARVKEVLT